MPAFLPTMRGIIDRRMLINFRARPEVVSRLLPSSFRPKLVRGWAMVGICLIRLKEMRPAGFPAVCGLGSENVAHRIAVEWDEGGRTREGVYIPRRDTSSSLQSLVGGKVFPGIHQRADFLVHEQNNEFSLQMKARDHGAFISLQARLADGLPATSLFSSLAEASDFFARGAMGYSATNQPDRSDGLELHTFDWQVEPLEIQSVKSSFFDDRVRFPAGTIEFDCALLMRGVEHEWRGLPTLQASSQVNDLKMEDQL
jgi:hypothetical protein